MWISEILLVSYLKCYFLLCFYLGLVIHFIVLLDHVTFYITLLPAPSFEEVGSFAVFPCCVVSVGVTVRLFGWWTFWVLVRQEKTFCSHSGILICLDIKFRMIIFSQHFDSSASVSSLVQYYSWEVADIKVGKDYIRWPLKKKRKEIEIDCKWSKKPWDGFESFKAERNSPLFIYC